MESPKLARIHVRYDDQHIRDIPGAVADEFSRDSDGGIAELKKKLSGRRIAIGVGSRGIANLREIVTAVVAQLRKCGAVPFVIPAMGSHGGATDEGQREVLESYEITERTVGAPIVSSMQTVELDANGLGHRVFMDRNAWESDGVLLVGRVKPHTDFHGGFESGLVKMAVIGLGKRDQATAIHSFGVRGLREKILPTARTLFATGKILGGVAIVENAYDRTGMIRLVPTARIEHEEHELLEVARKNLPSLPIDQIDVLIIDQIGKDISGTGMDTNIIGRIRVRGQEEPLHPSISSIVLTDLTAASHGNAVGVGLADVVTRRLFDKIDMDAMNANVITSSFYERGKIPLVAENDRRAFEYAVRGAALGDTRAPRVVRMIDTLHAHDLLVSPELLEEVRASSGVRVVSTGLEMFEGDRFIPFPP